LLVLRQAQRLILNIRKAQTHALNLPAVRQLSMETARAVRTSDAWRIESLAMQSSVWVTMCITDGGSSASKRRQRRNPAVHCTRRVSRSKPHVAPPLFLARRKLANQSSTHPPAAAAAAPVTSRIRQMAPFSVIDSGSPGV
jgi:hypothetical protein